LFVDGRRFEETHVFGNPCLWELLGASLGARKPTSLGDLGAVMKKPKMSVYDSNDVKN